MVNFSIFLTACATIFAAYAAWMSYKVSKDSLRFQQNFSMNQQTIFQLRSTIDKLRILSTYLPNVENLSDESFLKIEPLFESVKKDIEYLCTRKEDLYISNICEISDMHYLVKEVSKNNNFLNDCIKDLEKYTYSFFTKLS